MVQERRVRPRNNQAVEPPAPGTALTRQQKRKAGEGNERAQENQGKRLCGDGKLRLARKLTG